MIDTIQITDDFAGLLRSCPALLTVNVVRYDKLAIQGQIDWSLVWLTKRNNCVGAGLIIELPFASSNQHNVTGPILDWSFPILVVENPTINRSATGTNLKYDTLCQLVMDALHLYGDNTIGTFSVSGEAMTPVELAQFDGCLCFRVIFKITSTKSAQTPRAGAVTIALDGGNVCTLSSPTAGAQIYYTLDGTFPASLNGGNPGSVLYDAPFQAASGQKIRSVAYAGGHNNSVARSLLAA